MALFIFLLGLLPSLANGATVYVPTKNFAWQWGEPPGMFEDFFQGTSRIRAWLEAKSPPRLTDSTPSLRRMTKRYFDLEEPLTVRFAVMEIGRAHV